MSDTQAPKPNGEPAAEAPQAPPSASPSPDGAEAPSAAPAGPPDLETALAAVGKYKDQLLRTAADYDNFRKRARREADDARARGRDDTLAELLPVFDNLQRAVQASGATSDVTAIRSGIELVLTQLEGALSRIGVTTIETIGKAFDPTRHDAVQQLERADVPPGTVVAEVQRGYLNGERLVRAALVVVSRAPAHPAGDEPAPPGDGT